MIFAVDAEKEGRDDIVRRILCAVEEALNSKNPGLTDPFSIDFIEALATDRSKPHFASWNRWLGLATTRIG